MLIYFTPLVLGLIGLRFSHSPGLRRASKIAVVVGAALGAAALLVFAMGVG